MEPAHKRFEEYKAEEFYHRTGNAVGSGSVGGKAKGLAFASDALAGADGAPDVKTPALTAVLTTEVFDTYIDERGLDRLYDDSDWERVRETIDDTPLPDATIRELERLLDRFDEIGAPPIAVRSSSLLEDSVSLAFAGKYHTAFAPNCGSREEKLADLEQKVRSVYASLFSPSARAYREKHGHAHREESMAVVVQSMSGRDRDGMFYPELAGTIFSRVFRRPTPRIKKEDGLMRVCFGLGTRTVDRCAARTFYLTNPSLRPEGSLPAMVAATSQENFDYIDRVNGSFISGPLAFFANKIRREHRNFGAYVEFYADDFLYSALAEPDGPSRPLFSFPELHRREKYLFDTARELMTFMEEAAGMPMDMEFTYESQPERELTLVQMRPLTSYEESAPISIPDAAPERVLFRGSRMVANGVCRDVPHLVYVDPHLYKKEWSPSVAARAVGEINAKLADEGFILVGPGRWGSRNPALGVPVVYAELCNAKCLVEMSVPELHFSPELSFGTHFFLDMDSDGIQYLPVFTGESGNVFNSEWLASHPYTTGSHPSVRIYDGKFSVYLDGEEEVGAVIDES